MANIQHMADLGFISEVRLEHVSGTTYRSIIMDDEGSVADIREASSAHPRSLLSGLPDNYVHIPVVASWPVEFGKAVRVNRRIELAMMQNPHDNKEPTEL